MPVAFRPLETLLRRVVEGDATAWKELWARSQPLLWTLTGRAHITGRLSRNDDERRNIELAVMERLREDGFRRLRSYLESVERREASRFETWLSVVAKRTAIDYVRGHAEYRRQADAASSKWVELEALATDDVEENADGLTADQRLEATRLLELAGRVTEPAQRNAMALWLGSSDYAFVAERLGIPTPKEAERLVRAGLERIRSRVRSESR